MPIQSSKVPLRALILVLEVHALSSLARISRITDSAVLPVLVVHELAFELKSVVDICEAELDVVVLQHIMLVSYTLDCNTS